MKEDRTEQRAEALAEVLAEFLMAGSPGGPVAATREAYWVLEELRDPAGERGLWNAREQQMHLSEACRALRSAEEALAKLAPPVRVELCRNAKVRRALVLPPGTLEALAARKIRLEHLPDHPQNSRDLDADAPEGAEDPSKEITVYVGTMPRSVPVLTRQIRTAIEEIRPKIRRAIQAGDDLDARNWAAIVAYQLLEDLWEAYRGERPARYPKDGDPFYLFAERAFEALEIEGKRRGSVASVRSAFESLRAWEKKSELPDSEPEEN